MVPTLHASGAARLLHLAVAPEAAREVGVFEVIHRSTWDEKDERSCDQLRNA